MTALVVIQRCHRYSVSESQQSGGSQETVAQLVRKNMNLRGQVRNHLPMGALQQQHTHRNTHKNWDGKKNSNVCSVNKVQLTKCAFQPRCL